METYTANTVRTRTHGSVTWVDALRPDKTVLQQLEEQYQLHPVHVKESLQKVQHNEVEREANYLFLVLHIPVYNAHKHKICIHQLGIFLGKRFLITIRNGNIPAVERLSGDMEAHKSAAGLLYALIAGLLNDMFGIADHIESELDAIEGIVFDDSRSDAGRIGRVRQKIVTLSRVVGPKRVVLDDLAQQIGSFAGKDITPYFENNTKTVNRLWEIVDGARETVEIYKDADFTASTARTNRILAILTFLFTFSIPATVIAALYGMNVGLPGGLDPHEWTFWGPYTTFIIIIAVVTLSAIGMYAYFKRKKWM